MNSSILFIARKSKDADSYCSLLDNNGYKVIRVDQVPDQNMEPPPFLVIFRQEEDFEFSPNDGLPVDPSVPILLLENSPTTSPAILQDASMAKLVDYLKEPIKPDVLLAKVRFLQKVSKISHEHSGYLQSHDTFLDWFTSHDGLTGLFNRHHFNKTFKNEFDKVRESEGELSLLVLDIDYFAEINRTYGHSFGDFVLNELSARLTRATREKDICFRFTGGDFIILMPGGDLKTAIQTAEDIRKNCISKPFSRHETTRKVTVSIGIANIRSHNPRSGDELVNMAETALYNAKANGRNRCEVYFAHNEDSGISQSQANFDSLKLTISRLLEKTRRSAISSLQLLARDIAGEEHRIHIDKVSWYTNLLGKQLGLTPGVIQTLQNAVIIQASIRLLMHNDLISKPIELDEAERQILKDLPYKIAEITEVFSYFEQERSILLTRSEKYDGTGFPDGLRGDEIPLGSRIINIIDSFAAMGADRPFRNSFSPEMIIDELRRESGKQFDPFLVLKLIDLIEEKQLLAIDPELIEKTRSELKSSYPEL